MDLSTISSLHEIEYLLQQLLAPFLRNIMATFHAVAADFHRVIAYILPDTNYVSVLLYHASLSPENAKRGDLKFTIGLSVRTVVLEIDGGSRTVILAGLARRVSA